MSRVTDLLGVAPVIRARKPRSTNPTARAYITRAITELPDYANSADPLADMLNDLLGLCGQTYERCATTLNVRYGTKVDRATVAMWVYGIPGLRARIVASREKTQANLEARAHALGGDGKWDWQYWCKKAARDRTKSRRRQARKHRALWHPPGLDAGQLDRVGGHAGGCD